MDEKITFIIPSINRPTLDKTIDSLLKQTNKNWNCLIIYDGVFGKSFEDERIKTLIIPKLGDNTSKIGKSGRVRDYGLKLIDSGWVGFLDDDDTIDSKYVDTLYKKYQNYDFVLWRMKYESGKILPPLNSNVIEINKVGISFCYKKELFFDIYFNENVGGEDYFFLKKLKDRSKNYLVTPEIMYYVRS